MKKFSAKAILQKYGKVIMTIMSILLMFIFALPTFRNKTPDEAQQLAIATLNGKKVTGDDMVGERNELNFIDAFHLLNADQFGVTAFVMHNLLSEDSDHPQYWFVLRHEAAKYAPTVIYEDEAIRIMNELQTYGSTSMIKGYPTSEIDIMLGKLGASRRTLARVLSDLHTVENYLRFVIAQPRPITSYELNADKDLRRILVDFAAIDALSGWQQAPAPSTDQIQSQFDAYKKVLPTPVLSSADAPFLLGVQLDPVATPDSSNPYVAILGFPDAADKAQRVHVGDTLPWDGSKVTNILKANPFTGNPDLILLSGGGRSQPLPTFVGMDLQQRPLPPLPAEVAGHRFPFGYKYPDRVAVQYLVFNREEIRKTIPITRELGDIAFAAYKAEHPQTPATATASAPASSPAAGLAVAPPSASSQPAASQTAPAPATWDSLKDQYIKKEVDKATDRLIKRMIEWVHNRTDAPFKNTDWKDNPPPASKDWAPYDTLASDFAKVGDFNKYQPLVKDTGKTLLSARQLQAIPALGHAIYSNTQGQIFPFSVLATNVGELVPADKQTPLVLRNLHVGTEAPEVTDKDGNVYLFRVTAVDKAHEPASLSDDLPGVADPAIRQQVSDDCKKLATFSRCAQEIKDLLAKPEPAGGMDAVAAKFKVDVQKPAEFNRMENEAPLEIQGVYDFIKTAFTLNNPKTPAALTTLESGHIFKCFPMQLLRMTPVRAEDFGKHLNEIMSKGDPAAQPFIRSYLSVEAIAARIKFVPNGGFTKKN